MGRVITLLPRSSDVAWTKFGASVLNRRVGPGSGAAPAAAAAATAAVANQAGPQGNNPHWLNPIVGQSIDLSNANGVVIGANPNRCGILIQNNSASGGPNIWYRWGRPAKANGGTKIAPGAAILLDFTCPRSSLYVFVDAAGLIGNIEEYVHSPLPPNFMVPSGGGPSDIGIQAWGITSVGGVGNATVNGVI